MKIQQIVLLSRSGEILESFHKNKKHGDSGGIFPVIIENYLWDKKNQLNSAEKFKDKIKRVYYPEEVDKKIHVMLQDDIRRLKLIGEFNYGRRVLEVGCSDGTASIKIAEKKDVGRVIGIDIRQSAISDGKKLLKDLVKKGEIDRHVAGKVNLVKLRIEDIPAVWPKFDGICAYEVFEHMAPQDFLPAFQHLYKFLKPGGRFFMSVPNRFPNANYERLGRSRWKWFDHRNFFSELSLKIFLENFFTSVRFHPLYDGEKIADGIYLIAEAYGKKY